MASSAFARHAVNALLVPVAVGSSHLAKKDVISYCDDAVSAKRSSLLEDARRRNAPTTTTTTSRPVGTKLKTRMTSIGSFTLRSETPGNPSLPTFFLALTGTDDLTPSELAELWSRRDMRRRHPRLHATADGTHFRADEEEEDTLAKNVSTSLPFAVPRADLATRVSAALTDPLPTTERLWEARLASGPLGASGAVSTERARRARERGRDDDDERRETVVLFRSHHCVGDGVSMGAALTDLADEAAELRGLVEREVRARRKRSTDGGLLRRLRRLVRRVLWLWLGSIRALSYQTYLALVSAGRHPYRELLRRPPLPGRSVSWCDAGPVVAANRAAKTLRPGATINDLFVACVAAAVARQLDAHGVGSETTEVNVVLPVHLAGGVTPPGSSMGNRIGAAVARVRCRDDDAEDRPAQSRLDSVSRALSFVKTSPAALLSFVGARTLAALLPSSWAPWCLERANANAVATVSNVRGPPIPIRWNGREVADVAGFVPLPPGLHVGVAVTSYAGELRLTVNADRRVVPDADRFLRWTMEEYEKMAREAEAVSESEREKQRRQRE